MRTPLLWILIASVLSMGASPVPVVTVSSGRLSVSAKDVPLRDLLSAIGERAKIAIVQVESEIDTQAAIVTDSFSDLPLEQGINRLLRDCNYALEREGSTGTVKRVFILATQNRAPGVVIHASSASLADTDESVGSPSSTRELQSFQPIELLRASLQSPGV